MVNFFTSPKDLGMATGEIEPQDDYKQSVSEDELSSTLLRPQRTQVLKLILSTLPESFRW